MPSLSNEHLDLFSARQVPDSHCWPSSSRHDHPTTSSGDSVPIINLSSPDASSLIGAACRSWGAFYALGHGVPYALLGLLESQSRRLFSLPLHLKLLASRSPGSLSGFGPPPLSSFFPKLMWSEGFTLAGDPLVPASILWPHDSSLFCMVMEEYSNEMKKVAERLMKLMLRSLGVEEEDMDQLGLMTDLQRASQVLQLNSYPACPDPERAMGMAAHTDSAFLTVLHQSSGAGGLQVLRVEDGHDTARWVTVPPKPGALFVNVGDLFHVLSNGRFRSAQHRAVVSLADHRVSAAYFIGPPAHVKVGPIRRLVDPGIGPVFRPVTWPEYLGLRARLFDKALDSVKLQEKKSEKDS